MDRLIAHLDMDAFYASVEQLDDPALRGKPVVVGGKSNRGVVSAASYEARQYGVRSAMPMVKARRLCPHGNFVSGRMTRYQEISRVVMDLMRGFAPIVEPVSIDEAFMDLSGTEKIYGQPKQIGQRLKTLIKAESGLVCSVGLAPNRLVAKIASDFDKPDGLVIVTNETMADFLAPLAVTRLPGVGPKLAKRLKKLMSVATVADLRKIGADDLIRLIGTGGQRLFDMAWGNDETPIVSGREQPKSISAEQTMEEDIVSRKDMIPILADQALKVSRRLRRRRLIAKTVNLKLKHSDFRQITRAHTLAQPTDSTKVIFSTASQLLADYHLDSPIRLIGLGVSNLAGRHQSQPNLFEPIDEKIRAEKIDGALDDILEKFGSQAIKIGISIKKG